MEGITLEAVVVRAASRVDMAPRTHGFGRPTVVLEAVESLVRCLRVSLDHPSLPVRISVCDPLGRLHTLAAAGDCPAGVSSRRKAALRSGRSQIARPRGGRPIAVLPLSWQGHRLGVLEVECEESFTPRWMELLEAAAEQGGLLLHALRERAELEQGRMALGNLVELARKLVRAPTPEEAVVAALRFLHEQFELPMAAWLSPEPGHDLAFAGARGLGTATAARLARTMPHFTRWEALSPDGRTALVARFAAVAAVEDVAVVRAGRAAFMVGGASPNLRPHLDFAGELLGDIIDHLDEVTEARRRNSQLDFGIAMTAHEFRGPILGTKATIDHLILTNRYSAGQLDLLLRSRQELKLLSDLVEGLLRWSVDGGALACEPTSLKAVVAQAADTCRYETSSDRIVIAADGDPVVDADARQLRAAVANIIRNALAYSPDHTTVQISVRESGGLATVKVRDFGPGIPAEEQGVVFDPFMRGRTGRISRNGKGLGLFIARRIVEAHHGVVWLDSRPTRTAFCIQLPSTTRAAPPTPAPAPSEQGALN